MSCEQQNLIDLYDVLSKNYVADDWWPGRENPFEVIVGAVLIQRTTWTNTTAVTDVLRQACLLAPAAFHVADQSWLEALIRPAGFYRAKTATLKAFCSMLQERYAGDLSALFDQPVPLIRAALLSIRGIGDETADAILVYAAGKPSFIVDAYTRRLLVRLGWIKGNESYLEIQQMFANALAPDAALFASFHALFVQQGQAHCCLRPRCQGCPLLDGCGFAVQRKDVP